MDISATIDRKVESNRVNVTQGPAGENGARLRARLAAENRRLPILGDNDETANRQYIKEFVLDLDSDRLRGVPSDREVGRRFGLEWAEAFHYIGPRPNVLDATSRDTPFRCDLFALIGHSSIAYRLPPTGKPGRIDAARRGLHLRRNSRRRGGRGGGLVRRRVQG